MPSCNICVGVRLFPHHKKKGALQRHARPPPQPLAPPPAPRACSGTLTEYSLPLPWPMSPSAPVPGKKSPYLRFDFWVGRGRELNQGTGLTVAGQPHAAATCCAVQGSEQEPRRNPPAIRGPPPKRESTPRTPPTCGRSRSSRGRWCRRPPPRRRRGECQCPHTARAGAPAQCFWCVSFFWGGGFLRPRLVREPAMQLGDWARLGRHVQGRPLLTFSSSRMASTMSLM